MARYSEERKQAILCKVLPPESQSVREVALEQGIHIQTIYSWLKQVRGKSQSVSENHSSDRWSDSQKFSVVVETAALSEAELSQYCREKGLYPEQVKAWKAECMQGFQATKDRQKAERQRAKEDKQQIKKLKRELRQKEKALAETAALLVLRKKLDALWNEDEED